MGPNTGKPVMTKVIIAKLSLTCFTYAIHPIIYLFIDSFIYLLIYLFIYLFIYPLSIYLSFCQSIHLCLLNYNK